MEYKALPFSSVWENGIFNLPTKLVDEYLKLASEYQLKALLYIFRNNGQASTNAVAKALGQTVNDTDNLLEFWVEEGILSVDGNIVAQEIVPKSNEQKEKNIVVKETISAPTLSPKDIVTVLRESRELQSLVNEAQKVLGRTISTAEQAIIINMVNYYGLKPEVVLMILEYYRNEKQKGMSISFAYINAMAKNWSDEGISSIGEAEEKLQEIADTLIKNTGYNEISLMSLSSADYSCLPELVDHLMDNFKDKRVSVSLPSLRVDSFSVDIAKKVQQVRKSGLTLAPEAGTQRLRDVINKGITEDDIMGACSNAFRNGWDRVKLYFMMGLPTETDEDLKGIADLANRINELYHEIRGKYGCRITVSVASFVPKPFTPFQWMPQCSVEEIERKQKYLKSLFTNRHIKFAYHDARTGYMEAVLARGDRKLNQVILKAWQKGCEYDSWTEFFDFDKWMSCFEECGVDPDQYAARDRDEYEAEPWDHIDCGVTKDYLRKEWKLAQKGILTHDCRHLACNGCAVCPILDVALIDHKEENWNDKAVFIYKQR